jgi:uncharacterized membrane protein YraQ (UPF0718 family)/copper chaperone CopZ
MIDFLAQIWIVFVEMSPYLLLGISFVALLDLFISKNFITKQVGTNNLASIIKTAIFGIPLPLCSCGVVPTSVYLEKSGASKPSVVSFLISTPQTGIDSIVATYGMLGPVFAVFRPVAAFIMGIVGGIVTYFFQKNGKDAKTKKINLNLVEIPLENKEKNFWTKSKKSLRYAFIEFIDDISTQFLVGLIIAGAISFFLPNDFFASVFKGNEVVGMAVVILFAIPMYVCATASIPIAMSLMMKGFSPGIAYVFLVAGPVTNAASISILSKVLGKKLLVVYVSTVIVLAVLFGVLLNWIFSVTGIDPHSQMNHIHLHNHSVAFSIWDYIFALFFLILLLSSYYRKLYNKFKGVKMSEAGKISGIYKIEGMTCNHCVMNVEKAIRSVAGVENVEVNLSGGYAKIDGNFSVDDVKNAVEAIGYKFVGER